MDRARFANAQLSLLPVSPSTVLVHVPRGRHTDTPCLPWWSSAARTCTHRGRTQPLRLPMTRLLGRPPARVSTALHNVARTGARPAHNSIQIFCVRGFAQSASLGWNPACPRPVDTPPQVFPWGALASA